MTVRHQIGTASGFGSERWPASRSEMPSGFVGMNEGSRRSRGKQMACLHDLAGGMSLKPD